MVLGCRPSALPANVLSGRSSRIMVRTPYRARLELSKEFQHLLGCTKWDSQRHLRKHQPRRACPYNGDGGRRVACGRQTVVMVPEPLVDRSGSHAVIVLFQLSLRESPFHALQTEGAGQRFIMSCCFYPLCRCESLYFLRGPLM